MIGAHKICSECGESKPIEEFHLYRANRPGRSKICRSCYAAKVQARRERKWAGLPLEGREPTLSEVEADGVKVCRTCSKEKPLSEFYYEKRYDHHVPDCKECIGSKRSQNRRELREFMGWETRDPYNPNKRPRRLWVTRKLHLELGKEGHICYLCEIPISADELEFDHIIPISRGGSDNPKNIAPTHRTCNRRKGTKVYEEIS